MHKKQIFVIVSIVALMAVLLSLDIKGLVKPKDIEDKSVNAETKAEVLFNLENEIQLSKKTLNAQQLQYVERVEKKLDSDQSSILNLAKAWDSVSGIGISAFYYEQLAQKTPTAINYLLAADRFRDVTTGMQDSTRKLTFINKAISLYNKAILLEPKNSDAKTGLGVAYVNGTNNPMQGITLLLDVVKQEPENVNANLQLGLFSMKSGQHDKAVSRFTKVVNIAPTAEAYFYLGESYKNLGNKSEAKKAFLKCKEYIKDPEFKKGVDNYINELN